MKLHTESIIETLEEKEKELDLVHDSLMALECVRWLRLMFRKWSGWFRSWGRRR